MQCYFLGVFEELQSKSDFIQHIKGDLHAFTVRAESSFDDLFHKMEANLKDEKLIAAKDWIAYNKESMPKEALKLSAFPAKGFAMFNFYE